MENTVTFIHCLMIGNSSAVTHLLRDYSQFLLFTSLFYYFALHTFQIMGDSLLVQWVIWIATLLNVCYLSGFTSYVAYDMVVRSTQDYCKGSGYAGVLWLSMRASACAISVLLVGVGLFASHYLNKRRGYIRNQREAKLWGVIWAMIIATFLQLGYDIYEDSVEPNTHCIGLLPVTSIQKGNNAANAVMWLLDKLICAYSVDIMCVYALWPKASAHLPLLDRADSDPTIRSISNKPKLKSSLGSESSISVEEEEKRVILMVGSPRSVSPSRVGLLCLLVLQLLPSTLYELPYEQVLLCSVKGYSVDYAALSWTGYLAYSAYNLVLYFDPRYGYASVQDVVFAIHGWILVNITLLQCAYYDVTFTQNLLQRIGWATWGFKTTLWLLAGLFFLLKGVNVMEDNHYFGAVKYLGYIKVCTTVIKYTPQVALNWKRRSTKGWSLANVLLDFSGGFLSVVQMIADSAGTGHWDLSHSSFNVAKFTLGFVTMAFDLVFLWQFYRFRHSSPEMQSALVKTAVEV